MEFYLDKEYHEYFQGTEILLRKRGYPIGYNGISICVHVIEDKELRVDYSNYCANIFCNKKAHYFRGLMKLLKFLEEDSLNKDREFQINETVYFNTNGAMIDCSRNAVPKTETIRKFIRHLALTGMDQMFLYMEDTYEVDGYEYFGAFRGRYTKEELKECDDYANVFGIEIIPCIQTLAHLRTTLKWRKYDYLKDTDDILLTGDEKVYEFIEAMISSASEPFRTKQIHLGMDEAHQLGLGRYLDKNGYKTKFEIMEYHLKRVNEICEKYKLEPMIWSDMYFRCNAENGRYCSFDEESDFSNSVKPPQNVGMVYGDYYNTEENHYKNYFRLHRQLGSKVLFAGGGWIWNGMAPNYSHMVASTNAGLLACKASGIDNVMCTLWQDNGAETQLSLGAPALVLFAEHCFSREVTEDSIKETFEFVWKMNYTAISLLDKFDSTKGTLPKNKLMDNPSKYLLYQDVLLGLFDEQIKGLELGKHYKELYEAISNYAIRNTTEYTFMHYYKVLAKLLSHKAEMGIDLQTAYKGNDREKMEQIANIIIPECIRLSDKLRTLRSEMWFVECKPFGYEVLDIRLAGVSARLQSARRRIESYLVGEEMVLPELEEQRLLYDKDLNNENHILCGVNMWQNIISACNVEGV